MFYGTAAELESAATAERVDQSAEKMVTHVVDGSVGTLNGTEPQSASRTEEDRPITLNHRGSLIPRLRNRLIKQRDRLAGKIERVERQLDALYVQEARIRAALAILDVR